MATTSTVAPVNYRVPLLATAAIVLGALVIGVLFSANIGLLMIVGGLLGMVLYHAAFGFTAAWRVFITERRGRGLRAQMVMLAIAVLPGAGRGQPVWYGSARLRFSHRYFCISGRVYLRGRYAARRWLCFRHAVYRRRR